MASGELAIPDFEDDIEFGDLVLQYEIGQGAFGRVFKGSYFGTDVAIKVIAVPPTPEEKTFLRREVAILKGIRHPNTVQFIGVTTDPNSGASVIVTDYVPGGNLRSVLKDTSRSLSWEWRVNIATDIAGGMAYLHAKSIIFRDLKSKNILVHGNKAKICDFGLARATQAIRPMTICGTDDWMAPEVILGMDYDTQADVFSYGIVLLEIISRAKVQAAMQRSPMDAFGLNEDKIMAIIPSEAPPEFTALALECCTYEPKKRPLFKNIVQYLNNLAKILPKEDAAPAISPAMLAAVTAAATPTPTPAAPSATALPPPSVGAPPVRLPPSKGAPPASPKGKQPPSPTPGKLANSTGSAPSPLGPPKAAPKVLATQPKAKMSPQPGKASPLAAPTGAPASAPKASPKPAAPKAIPGVGSGSSNSPLVTVASKVGGLQKAASLGTGLTAPPPKAGSLKMKQWPPPPQ